MISIMNNRKDGTSREGSGYHSDAPDVNPPQIPLFLLGIVLFNLCFVNIAWILVPFVWPLYCLIFYWRILVAPFESSNCLRWRYKIGNSLNMNHKWFNLLCWKVVNRSSISKIRVLWCSDCIIICILIPWDRNNHSCIWNIHDNLWYAMIL